MANFIVAYDLNGPRPSHREMDEMIKSVAVCYGRVLESVWWVHYAGTAKQLIDRLKANLRPEDLLLVVEATGATWTKLLVKDASLIDAWRKAS